MVNEVKGNVLRGHLESMILSLLERGPAHGFEIMQSLERASEGILRLKEGSLYPALYRLEENGLLRGKWETNAKRRGPRRRIYSLTPKGKKRLFQSRENWKHFARVVGGIMEAV